ncbi:unnamed protein product [Arctogadus glacialis]
MALLLKSDNEQSTMEKDPVCMCCNDISSDDSSQTIQRCNPSPPWGVSPLLGLPSPPGSPAAGGPALAPCPPDDRVSRLR